MTKRLRLIFLVATLFLSARVSAQLMITNMSGFPIFPAHADSIQPYSPSFTIFNSDSVNMVVDYFDILFAANARPVDTLVSDTGTSPTTLFPMNSIVRSTSQFHFNTSHFDDGDNIVVIWPNARNTPGIGDSTTIHIYYDSHVGIDEPNPLPIKIYPNPASEYLYLGGVNQFKLKRVRILDAIGKEIYNGLPASELISIKDLVPGAYVISVESVDGRHKVIQFVKE